MVEDLQSLRIKLSFSIISSELSRMGGMTYHTGHRVINLK
jgi:hypothetical protein